MTSTLALTLEQKNLLLGLLQRYLPGVGVWVFGSRAKGKARPVSDLDLVLFSTAEQRPQVFALQEALEESRLPFRVDLLIWDEIPDSFKANIQSQYIELVAGSGSSPA